MLVSVRLLYNADHRIEPWRVLTAHGSVGYLVLEWNEFRRYREARLIGRSGRELAPMLIYAKIEQCKGPKGMLVEGIQPRQRGSKHTWNDRQAWWCHSPPRPDPLRTIEELKRTMTDEFSSIYDDDPMLPHP